MKRMDKTNSRAFGASCEWIATRFLMERGYKILCTNFRTRTGEIDIIAEKDGYVIFVEVKARRSKRCGLPQEAVTPYKQRSIRKVALTYLQKEGLLDLKVRFDVIAIVFENEERPSIEHIPFAF